MRLAVGIFCFISVATLVSSEACDLEATLRTILTPQPYPTMQLHALRRELLRRLQNALENAEDEEDFNYQRSLSALARWNDLPYKRNLEALARAGYLKPPTAEEAEDTTDSSLKRSIASLAKSGQLPEFSNERQQKRGVQSLARNGELRGRRGQNQHQGDKRNIGSLARNFDFPSYGKRFIDKRNVAALLRMDRYTSNPSGDEPEEPQTSEPDEEKEKRNLGSIKAQYKSSKLKRSTESLRNKRQANYYPSYEEEDQEETGQYVDFLGNLPEPLEKRFLGRLPQMGKTKTTPPPKTRFH